VASAADLVKRVRRRLRDWPELDKTTASIAAGGVTLTVSDTTFPRYYPGSIVEVDYEVMIVQAVAGGTTLTVQRAARGSTDASHPNGSTVLFDPAFTSMEILDGINDGLDALWPMFYQDVVDETTFLDPEIYEYTVPNVSVGQAIPIPRIHELELRESGFTQFIPFHSVDIVRGATPKLRLKFSPPSGATLRIRGYAPLPHLAFTDSTFAQLPYNADNLAATYAAAMLLIAGEAGRVRHDLGPVDTREQATRVGASAAAGREWMRLFFQQRADLAMPPLKPHVTLVT
jgi:hypothetical protein